MERQIERLWIALWARIGAKGDPRKVYKDLAARYSEPLRAYHTIEHVEDCLVEFLPAWHLARDPCAVEFGIWYHDAVKGSEEKSAAVAMDVAIAASLPISFGQKVERLIIATKHSIIPTSQDEQLIVDVDLSILGQPKGRFDEYERQIRREYKHVPWDTFVAKRSAILRSFQDRPAIYLTQFFRDKYEAQARQNIARSLKQLAGGI